MTGSGSKRASAFRIGPDGGSASLSVRRIEDRCTSCRSEAAPGVCSATAPRIHVNVSAIAAPSSAPSEASRVCAPRIRRSPMIAAPIP